MIYELQRKCQYTEGTTSRELEFTIFHSGLRTVYIRRTTEDPEENMEQIEREVDIFIDGRDPQGGLLRLATLWDSNH